jgi:hypothetical protein
MAKAEAQQEDPAAVAARRQVEQQRERDKRARQRAALGGLWSRRDVFGRARHLRGVLRRVATAAVRSAFRRALFQPSSFERAPSDHTIGREREVEERPCAWIIRTRKGSPRSALIGCTPRGLTAENKFKCPCHIVTRRYKTGVNLGPAPRPWVRIMKVEDGQIVTDKSIKYLYRRATGRSPAPSEGLTLSSGKRS